MDQRHREMGRRAALARRLDSEEINSAVEQGDKATNSAHGSGSDPRLGPGRTNQSAAKRDGGSCHGKPEPSRQPDEQG